MNLYHLVRASRELGLDFQISHDVDQLEDHFSIRVHNDLRAERMIHPTAFRINSQPGCLPQSRQFAAERTSKKHACAFQTARMASEQRFSEQSIVTACC